MHRSRIAHTMAQQPNLFSPDPAELAPGASPPGAPADSRLAAREPGDQHRTRQQYARWMQRIELLVRVVVRLYLGLLITALPWMRFWTENGLLSFSRTTALFTGNGFVRGLVSGLGVLNVAIAVQELFLRKPRS